MADRGAQARWEGSLKDGKGKMKVKSGAFEVPFSFKTRFEDEPGTNPEELIGAAHAGCFSMAFAAALGEAGHKPESVDTTASVHFGKAGEGFAIQRINLKSRVKAPGIEDQDFQRIAEEAKRSCPVSKALAGVLIELDATLES